MMKPVTNLEKVERYLRAIENGDFAHVIDLFSPDAVVEQLPNRIYPNGIKSELSTMADAFVLSRGDESCSPVRATKSKIAWRMATECRSKFYGQGRWHSLLALWLSVLRCVPIPPWSSSSRMERSSVNAITTALSRGRELPIRR